MRSPAWIDVVLPCLNEANALPWVLERIPNGARVIRSGCPVETVLRAADAGWRIDQVDVDYHERIGRSKVTGTMRGYVQAVGDMSAVLAS